MGEARFLKSGIVIPSLALLVVQIPLGKRSSRIRVSAGDSAMYLPPVLRPVAVEGNSALRSSGSSRLRSPSFAGCPVPTLPSAWRASSTAGTGWATASGSAPRVVARPTWQSLWEWPAGTAGHLARGRRRRIGCPTPSPPLSDAIQQAPEGAVIVLELGGRVTAGVARLIMTIRPAVTSRRVRLVVVAESRFHPPTGLPPDWVVQAADLLDRGALAEYSSARNQARLTRYAGRRAAVLQRRAGGRAAVVPGRCGRRHRGLVRHSVAA